LTHSDRATQWFDDVERCCDALLQRTGRDVVLGLPLGIGKSNRLTNALVARAKSDPSISLTIITALTLEVPRNGNLLQKRFLKLLQRQLYADYEELEYAVLRRADALPANIRVIEFYLQPGSLLGNAHAQQNYLSSNYSQALDDLLQYGVNVIAQMVAPHPALADRISLSSNPDITAMLIARLDAEQRSRMTLIAELNPQLPYMHHDAEVAITEFDFALQTADAGSALFAVPNQPIAQADHAVGLLASSLIPDGGTLQVGIGNLGDALVHALMLRQLHNVSYQTLLAALCAGGFQPEPAETAPFAAGLYGNSEMFVEGFLDLHRAGILKRCPAGSSIWLHAGFFLGSARFYQRLRDLPEPARAGIGMSAIDFTNTLRGNRDGKIRDRQDARFFNSAMKVTLTGAVISDGLEDAQVISGVGGQYEFVSQALELPAARSIIMLRSTRTHRGETHSNILWQYPHTTLPRHLRDIVVTEYGIADLRGKTDRETIIAMLAVTDSRFQDVLRRQAVAAGKLEASFELPIEQRKNLPEMLPTGRAEWQGLLPHFPQGTDFKTDTALIAIALSELKSLAGSLRHLLPRVFNGWRQRRQNHQFHDALATMNLQQPRSLEARIAGYLLLDGLLRVVAAQRPLQRNPNAGTELSIPDAQRQPEPSQPD